MIQLVLIETMMPVGTSLSMDGCEASYLGCTDNKDK